jgi:predicted PurR-regulated permease PerM
MDHSKASHTASFVFAVCLIATAFTILQSFLFGLLWGAVMAVSVWPFYVSTSRGTNPLSRTSTSFRAGIFSLLVAVLFVAPMAYAIYELANAYVAGSHYLTQNTVHGVISAPAFISYLPLGDKLTHLWDTDIGASTSLMDALNKISNGRLLEYLPRLWSQILEKVLTLVVMLVSLFFMLKHGALVQARHRRILVYWTGPQSVRYVNAAIEALRGTINGVLLVGAIEGVLLAIPLVMGGVTAGLLIGLCAGFMGVIPLLMPLLVLPCLGYLYLSGQTVWAVVGAVDLVLTWVLFENLIKPLVIGKHVRINAFLILMAMVGGLQTMGLVGLILGPACVAVALGLMQDLVLTVPEDTPPD